MSDKCSFRDISPPRSAYELLMEQRRLHPEVSMWFTDEICTRCKFPVYTDGKTKWCSPKCKVPGTYAALQEDYIR